MVVGLVEILENNLSDNTPKVDNKKMSDAVASNAAILWATSSTLRIVQLLTMAILTRILAPQDYGVIALATTVVGFIDMLSNLQVGGALIKTRDITNDHIDTAYTISVIRGILSAIVIISGAGLLSQYMNEPRLLYVLYAMAIPTIIGAFGNPNVVIYSKRLDFSKEIKIQSAAAVIGALSGIIAAFALRNYWAIVISSICSSASNTILSYLIVAGRPKFGLKKVKELFSYGTWLILISVMDYINSRIDYFLIGKRIGSETLGSYHIGQQVTMMATGDMVGPLSRALFPAFSLISHDAERLRSTYRQVQSMTLAIALPVGFGVSASAREVVTLLVGPQWGLAASVITFLAPLIAIQTMFASIETIALSLDRGRDLFIRTAIFLVFRAALLYIGYELGGFMGIIYARIVTGSFFIVYGMALAAKITNGKMIDPILSSWRSVVSVAIMYGAVRMLPELAIMENAYISTVFSLSLKVVTGASVYIFVHFYLWAISGKPNGVESKILEYVSRIRSKIKI